MVWQEPAKHAIVDASIHYPVLVLTEDDLVGKEDVEDYARKFTNGAAAMCTVDKKLVDPTLDKVKR